MSPTNLAQRMMRPAGRTARPMRRSLRIAAAFAVVAAVLLPLAFVFAQFWTSTGDNLRFVNDERRGVAYLQPLVRLLGTLTDAQSAATRGKPIDVAQLRAAVAAVDAVDQAQDDRLRTRQRWSQLRAQIEAATARGTFTGEDAYATYSETNDLVLSLMAKIGDTSNLILDPELDSYYLMDTALLRLPQVLVDAGRLADLSALLASTKSATGSAQLAVARDRVATTADTIDVGLRKSFSATSSKTLGPNLLGQLDAFRSAANDLAPSSLLLRQSDTGLDPEALASARAQLERATLQMAGTTLAELDALLSVRGDHLDGQRTAALVAFLIGALAGAVVLWQRLPGPSVVAPAPTGADGAASPFDDTVDEDDEAFAVQDLVDARALLQSDELVRVGRAVRSNRRERDDDSR